MWRFGALGCKKQSTPSQLEELKEVSICSLDAGRNSCFCIDTEQNIYCWGQNSFGELGLGDYLVREKAVKHPFTQTVASIASGSRHTVFLTVSGELYTCGDSIFDQLGQGPGKPECADLQKVQFPDGVLIASVKCGFGHTLCIDTEGKVWGFGYNKNCELGTCGGTNVPLPICIPGLVNISQISVGGHHNVLRNDSGDVIVFGNNSMYQLGDLGCGSVLPTHLNNEFASCCAFSAKSAQKSARK